MAPSIQTSKLRIGIPKLNLRALNNERRDSGEGPSPTAIIATAAVVGVIVLLAIFVIIRTIRSRNPNPKYIPTPVLKKLWTKWNVPPPNSQRYEVPVENAEDYGDSLHRDSSHESHDQVSALPSSPGHIRRLSRFSETSTNSAAGVARNTSIRSIMTLPAYNQKPAETEQVLGREGERDGLDVVLVHHSAAAEEVLRDEEMDALYQIRQARRRQMAERDERRVLRQAARSRNDIVALDSLRNQTRDALSNNTEEIDNLRVEHARRKENRQRAVSSVSYADVGIANSDGTRIRANSAESERMGLLEDAASMGGRRSNSFRSVAARDSVDVGPVSPRHTMESQYSHYSIGSIAGVRSRANSGATAPRLGAVTPEIIDTEGGDLGGVAMPPPGYDDVNLEDNTPVASRSGSPYPDNPPDYDGPAHQRAKRLSQQIADLAAETTHDEERRSNPSSHESTPRIPNLVFTNGVPQIIIEPSSALPTDDGHSEHHFR